MATALEHIKEVKVVLTSGEVITRTFAVGEAHLRRYVNHRSANKPGANYLPEGGGEAYGVVEIFWKEER